MAANIQTELVIHSSLAQPAPHTPRTPSTNLPGEDAKDGEDDKYDDNTDEDGWALIESYLWDIGESEEVERLIDGAIRIILIHPTFDTLIWKRKETITKLYDDQLFREVAGTIHRIMLEISKKEVLNKIESKNKKTFFSKFDLNKMEEVFNHIAGKSDLNEDTTKSHEKIITPQEEEDLADMSDDKLFGVERGYNLAERFSFWNLSNYTELKKKFGIKNDTSRETYVWSFLLIIACTIKYLEIEINAMPQFDPVRTEMTQTQRKKQIWKGFVVAPNQGTVAVNYDEETKQNLEKLNTQFAPIDIKQTKTMYQTHLTNEARKTMHCDGCFVELLDCKWAKEEKPLCPQCVKLRVYQECVRKFVLEYDNEEIRDDLWPWYQNSKNQADQKQYKDVLDLYADQVLQIGSIRESNVKYYVPRAQTLANAQKNKHKSQKNMDDANKKLLLKSHSKFQPYNNIRYLRKFAAIFLLGEREIWMELLKLKKEVKSKNPMTQIFVSDTDADFENANKINTDKSAIDDDVNYRINEKDRKSLMKILDDEQVRELLYGSHGRERHDELQQDILRRKGTVNLDNVVTVEILDEQNHIRSSAQINIQNTDEGVDKFLLFFTRSPQWWEPLHDRILLELALMHKLDVSAYYDELDDEEYYQEILEEKYYRAFEFWCTKPVNVLHRLRFLLYVINNVDYPDSMVFMSPLMKKSHLNIFGINDDEDQKEEKRQEESNAASYYSEEKPVRDIEREFRDIVQLLEPEALGVRIWRFIMAQMAAKQKKSLWFALTILASELPTSMVLALLEEDRLLLRRGKSKYVNSVCQAIIKGSAYSIATSLFLAGYMDVNARTDLGRGDTWSELSDQYELIAIDLVNEIENDHLLALLLEIPTDIDGGQTLIEMAVLNHRIRFVNDARIQGIMTHIWCETEFLNPQKQIQTAEPDSHDYFKLLWKSPVRFYFCPMGLYATTAVLYVLYLMIVTKIAFDWVYPYSEFSNTELLMWLLNAGYILYEVLEAESKRGQYFALDSIANVFDVIISINWMILFVMRIVGRTWANKGEYATDLDSNDIDAYKNNDQFTVAFMGIWSIQLIVLWVRSVGLLQRTELMGPLLTMCFHVARDVLSFLILVFCTSVGFLFAVYYVVSGDIDRDVQCEDLEVDDPDCEESSQALASVKGCAMYLFQTLLGSQDWDTLDENDLYGFGRSRARLLTLVIIAYIAIAGILCLNMLIAIMTTAFEHLNTKAKQELVFFKVETTFDLSHRGRIMPPPLNIFVIIVWCLITFLNMLVKGMSWGHCKLRLDHLNPLSVGWLARGKQHGINTSMAKSKQKGATKKKQRKELKKKKELLAKRFDTMYDGGLQGVNENEETPVQDVNENAHSSEALQHIHSDGGHKHTNVSIMGKSIGDFDFLSLFEEIDSMTDDTTRRYCKHCYRRMAQLNEGNIDDYFDSFQQSENQFGLDKDDMQMIRRLFRYCSLCPSCYHPYAIGNTIVQDDDSGKCGGGLCCKGGGTQKTDRYDRHHVLMEVISCWIFLIICWLPLCFLCFWPAFFQRLFNGDKGDQNEVQYNNYSAFGDYHKGSSQEAVKKIVENSNKLQQNVKNGAAFTDNVDWDSSDDDNKSGDDDDDDHKQLLGQILQKFEEQESSKNADIYYKRKKQTHSNRKTTLQLQQLQRQKKAKARAMLDIAKLRKSTVIAQGQPQPSPVVGAGGIDNNIMGDSLMGLKKNKSKSKGVSFNTDAVVVNSNDIQEEAQP